MIRRCAALSGLPFSMGKVTLCIFDIFLYYNIDIYPYIFGL